LVLGDNGEKLSKQNGATALDITKPLDALNQAGLQLNLQHTAENIDSWLSSAISIWRTYASNAPLSKG
jgi:glutamyl-Q tRNA(Asp) synthetase